MNTRSTVLSKLTINSIFLLSSLLQINLIHAEQLTDSTNSLHSHQNIRDTARQFLNDNIEHTDYSRVTIQMNSMDSRLKLSQCIIPLTSTLAQGSQFTGKTTVHVRCNSTTPWTVYVGAKISLFGEVVQTSEPLTKGHILKKDNLILVEKDMSRIKYGYFTKIDQLVGKELKRRLAQNKTLKANYVKSPTLVKRGEIVSIVAENKGYSVKMSGTALSSGARGDRIRVKNSSSNRIIEGVIKESGIVSIF